MIFAGVDTWAIFIAAVAGNVVGAVWYWALAKPWMAANNLGEESFRREEASMPALVPYAVAFAAQLIMAMTLAGIIGHLGIVTLKNGIISGAMCWLGFVISTMVVNHTFAERSRMLLLIDGGYWLLVLVAMGGIIGGLGVHR